MATTKRVVPDYPDRPDPYKPTALGVERYDVVPASHDDEFSRWLKRADRYLRAKDEKLLVKAADEGPPITHEDSHVTHQLYSWLMSKLHVDSGAQLMLPHGVHTPCCPQAKRRIVRKTADEWWECASVNTHPQGGSKQICDKRIPRRTWQAGPPESYSDTELLDD